jgi:hypothetical protein
VISTSASRPLGTVRRLPDRLLPPRLPRICHRNETLRFQAIRDRHHDDHSLPLIENLIFDLRDHPPSDDPIPEW